MPLTHLICGCKSEAELSMHVLDDFYFFGETEVIMSGNLLAAPPPSLGLRAHGFLWGTRSSFEHQVSCS